MRQSTLFDPRLIRHVGPTLEGFLTAYGNIYDSTGENPKWVAGQGNVDNALTLKWQGRLRVQPNIDWRARTRNNTGEFDATMATRFNIPFDKNEYQAQEDVSGNIIQYSADPVFSLGDVIIVTKVNGPGQETLLNKRFTVRNALPSTYMFGHDILADGGTVSRYL